MARTIAVVAGGWLLLWTYPARGADPAAVDALGDPLPAGAFARLGSARFAVPLRMSSLRFTGDGKHLVVIAEGSPLGGHTAQILDSAGREIRRRKVDLSDLFSNWSSSDGTSGFNGASWAVSPDGRLLAAVDGGRHGRQNALRLMNLISGQELCTIKGELSQFVYVNFTPDGKSLAILNRLKKNKDDWRPSHPGIIQLCDLQGKELRRFTMPEAEAGKPATVFRPALFQFSPDDKLMACWGKEGKDEGVIRIWDLAGDGKSRRLPVKKNAAAMMRFSPDSKLLAEYSDGHVRLWEPRSGKQVKDLGALDGCQGLFFSPDGKRLVIANESSTVQLLDWQGGQTLFQARGSTYGVAFSPDSKLLALGGIDQRIELVNTETGKKIELLDGFSMMGEAHGHYRAAQNGGGPLAFSPDGKTLVTPSFFGALRLWDVATRKRIHDHGNDGAVFGMVFSSDGRMIATAGTGGVALWDAAQKKLLRRLAWNSGSGLEELAALNLQILLFTEVAFSPDGKAVAAGWGDGTVTMWRAADGKLLWRGREHGSAISNLLFVDGRRLISAGLDGQTIWWDAEQGKVKHRMRRPGGKDDDTNVLKMVQMKPSIAHAALSPHGRMLAEIDKKGVARFIELATGKERRAWDAYGKLTFARGGRSVLESIPGGLIWRDLGEVEPRRYFQSRNDRDFPFAPAPPSRRYSAATDDKGHMRVWETATGTLLGEVNVSPFGAWALAFSPDEKTIAVSAQAGSILLSDLERFRRARPKADLPALKPLPPQRAPFVTVKEHERTGAIARLGSLRFQHAQPIHAVSYSRDGKRLMTSVSRNYLQSISRWDALGESAQQLLETAEIFSRYGELTVTAPQFAIDQDSRFLAMVLRSGSSDDPRLRVLDLASSKLVMQVTADVKFSMARLSADGKRLVGHCRDGFVVIGRDDKASSQFRIYDVSSGREIRRIEITPQDAFVPDIFTISSDSRWLAAMTTTKNRVGEIRIWDLNGNGRPLQLPERSLDCGPIAFSPDGSMLAVVGTPPAGGKARLRLWDCKTGKPGVDLAEHEKAAQAIFFSRDGKHLASLDGKKLRAWDLPTGMEYPAIDKENIECFQFSPDGKLLAVSDAKAVSLIDVVAGRKLRDLPGAIIREWTSRASQESRFYDMEHGLGAPMSFSPDGKILAVADERTVRRYDVPSGRNLDGERTPLHYVALSRDCRTVATASATEVLLWDAPGGKVIRRFPTGWKVDVAMPAIGSLTLSPDGKMLAAGSVTGEILMWKVADKAPPQRLAGHGDRIASLVFVDDSKTLLSDGDDLLSVWWDIATGKKLRSVAAPGPKPTKIDVPFDLTKAVSRHASTVISPNRKLFAGCDIDSLWIAEMANGKLRNRIKMADVQGSPVFSPDSRFLAVPGPGQVTLFNATTSKEIRVFAGIEKPANLVFSPDGRLLAAGGDNGWALWEAATGTVLAMPAGHRARVEAVAFSADGRTIATTGFDSTVQLWDVATLLAPHFPAPLSAKELTTCWQALAGSDAKAAYQAMTRLAARPEQAVDLIRKHVKPAAAPDEERIRQLIAAQESKDFAVRNKANQELELLEELAAPALRQALAGKPPLEAPAAARTLAGPRGRRARAAEATARHPRRRVARDDRQRREPRGVALPGRRLSPRPPDARSCRVFLPRSVRQCEMSHETRCVRTVLEGRKREI